MFSSLVAAFAMFGTMPQLAFDPGYLHKIEIARDRSIELRGKRYAPQPGDILLFDDHSSLTAKIYRFGGTGNPLHAGIVFRRDDGSLGILEAGTNAVMKVFVWDFEPRLHGFDGTILVRQPRTAMTPEQAKKLADFAVAQEGKPYAIGRLALQATPFRPRVLASVFGRTVVDRDRWICSELVVAGATVAGVWEMDTFPANVMYPRDLCYDEKYDLSPYYETPALWYPREVLERIGDGVRVGKNQAQP
jgi:hypothetical protein